MKYLYLKLGKSNSQLNYWLKKEENLFKKPSAVIYFGKITTEKCKSLFELTKNEIESLRKKDGEVPTNIDLHNQIKKFIKAGENKDVKFISIHDNKVCIYEPDTEVFDMPVELYGRFYKSLEDYGIKKADIEDIKNSTPKIMHVKIVKIVDKGIPYILRTLNVNQYFNRGTCREIKEKDYWGIIQAIKKILKQKRDYSKKLESYQMFKLLSPHQFETLIFLILINAGLFSPAWRAGSLPDIDIIGINYSDSEVKIGNNPTINFKKDKEIKFQVKRKSIKEAQNADYTIALSSSVENDNSNRILTSDWLLDVIKNQTETKKWLENSLRWFIKNTNKNSIFELFD